MQDIHLHTNLKKELLKSEIPKLVYLLPLAFMLQFLFLN